MPSWSSARGDGKPGRPSCANHVPHPLVLHLDHRQAGALVPLEPAGRSAGPIVGGLGTEW